MVKACYVVHGKDLIGIQIAELSDLLCDRLCECYIASTCNLYRCQNRSKRCVGNQLTRSGLNPRLRTSRIAASVIFVSVCHVSSLDGTRTRRFRLGLCIYKWDEGDMYLLGALVSSNPSL